MKTNIVIYIMVVLCCFVHAQDLPKVSSGTVTRIENLQSQNIAPRHVDVWLPADYTPSKKYNVVYMHDGQMLFDSTLTWNKKEWQVDEVISQLINKNKIEECIDFHPSERRKQGALSLQFKWQRTNIQNYRFCFGRL